MQLSLMTVGGGIFRVGRGSVGAEPKAHGGGRAANRITKSGPWLSRRNPDSRNLLAGEDLAHGLSGLAVGQSSLSLSQPVDSNRPLPATRSTLTPPPPPSAVDRSPPTLLDVHSRHQNAAVIRKTGGAFGFRKT